EGDRELRAVAQHQRDAIAGAYAALRERAGCGDDPLLERRPSQPRLAAHERLALRVARHRLHEHLHEARRPLREAAHRPVEVPLVLKRRSPSGPSLHGRRTYTKTKTPPGRRGCGVPRSLDRDRFRLLLRLVRRLGRLGFLPAALFVERLAPRLLGALLPPV